MTIEEAASNQTTPERFQEIAFNSPEIDLIIASNSKAPKDVLTQLAQSEHNKIRKAVTSNANTPTDILFKLGEDFPAELLANPVFNLMLLANPNLLREMPSNTLARILSLPNIKESFIIWSLNHRREQYILSAIVDHHLKLWNYWRQKNPDIPINLSWANLSWVNLKGANLESANLRQVNLEGANLEGANLKKAQLIDTKINDKTIIDDKWRLVYELVNHKAVSRNLERVDLEEAYLFGAQLAKTNLRKANLKRASLFEVNLQGANLEGANLKYTNLTNTTLSNANLTKANLKGANLNGANLSGANLSGANIRNTIIIPLLKAISSPNILLRDSGLNILQEMGVPLKITELAQTWKPIFSEISFIYIILEKVPGNQKIAILKQVRINTQLGLKAAKDLVQSFPNLLPVFPKDVPTAQTIKTALENAGATVSII